MGKPSPGGIGPIRRGMRSARRIHLLNCSRKKAQFVALPVVDRIESLASMLPPHQEERLALVAEIAPLVDIGLGDVGERRAD